MPQDTGKELTRQFYAWEQRGRGWLLYDSPVDLEPPFHPFFFHSIPKPKPIIDDGKRQTILSWLVSQLKPDDTDDQQDQIEPEEEDIEGFLFDCDEPLRTYAISFPKGQKVTTDATEQLLLLLSNCTYPLSFEIIATSSRISLQLVCRSCDALYAISQVKAYFPECILKEREDLIGELIQSSASGAICDYGLRDEFMRPLKMATTFTPDPLIGIFGALEHLTEGDSVAIQILFTGTYNPWSESIIRSVSDNEGKPFFSNAPEMLPLAKEKISSPLFAVTMKVLGMSRTMEQAQSLVNMTGSAFGRIYISPHNSLIPLSNEHDFTTQYQDILTRESHRLGMLLNTKELATIVHLPSESVTSTKLERNTRKTKAAPSITEGHTLSLGLNEHQGKEKQVTVSSTQRLKHTHLIGSTGTGKSTLLLNMISQDLHHGEGVCVIDPHGDLIENILQTIPEHRIIDVIVFDPADSEYPVGFNILSAHSEIEKDILSSDLVAVFKRLSTSWGDQMNSVFANAILALLESSEGGTLVDLRRFLVEKPFRDTYLKSVSDPSIVYYWQKEFPLIKSTSIGPILTRLDTFLRPKLIRNMVAQKKGLDFEQILDSKKILLVKLSQGLIGNENSYLLGTFFVTKMYQAAMARQIQSKEARSDYYLYIDEFQNFITPSISQLLAGARKYHLGLTLAHQEMQQLVKYDSELANSLVSNAGTRICFRLGDTDAKRFASGFSFFDPEDLENLNTGEAIMRIERPEYDFSLTTNQLQYPDERTAEQTKLAVIAQSRAKYGSLKHQVEAALQETMIRTDQDKETIKKEETLLPIPPEVPPTIKPVTVPIPPQSESETAEKLKKHKEQTQHRYLQTLIKKMAESRGYIARLEEPTPDGKGRVDVSLEKNGRKTACEICVTTEKQWEVHNIEKCLAAGYSVVIACSTDKKTLENIKRKALEIIDAERLARVYFLEPEELFLLLDDEVTKNTSTETIIKGYRVKAEYGSVSTHEAKSKNASVGKTVATSLKKKK